MAGPAGQTATITLPIDPRYGQEVLVVRAHGRDALWVELQGGEHTILPATWTSWLPRTALAAVNGRIARLAPQGATSLAAYVAARCGHGAPDDSFSVSPTEKSTDVSHAPAKESATGRATRRKSRPAHGERGRHRAPAAMVEQAGASAVPRGSSAGERGAP